MPRADCQWICASSSPRVPWGEPTSAVAITITRAPVPRRFAIPRAFHSTTLSPGPAVGSARPSALFFSLMSWSDKPAWIRVRYGKLATDLISAYAPSLTPPGQWSI